MSNKPAFQPLHTIPTESLKRVQVVLADIDDTLTTEGRLTAKAYGAIERLESAGIAVAPVTGRPAGWCDHIARMWPVAGVIGENGALYFSYDRRERSMRRVYAQDDTTRAATVRVRHRINRRPVRRRGRYREGQLHPCQRLVR